MPEDLRGTIEWILSYATEEDLDRIFDALKQRRKILATTVAASLMPGDKVTIVNIRPKIYEGLTGTFTGRAGRETRCAVMLDEASTRKLRRYNLTAKSFPDRSIPEDAKEYLLTGMPIQSLRPC